MTETSRASRSALVLLAVSLWLAASEAAPAPSWRKRPQRPPAACVLVWHGGRYRASFGSGFYRAWDGRHAWHGTYRIEGGRLCVRERAEGASGGAFEWSCDLAEALAGRGPVTLEAR